MAGPRGRNAQLGDVVEIATRAGLTYALYTHQHDEPPRYGALLRVFEGFHRARPSTFGVIVQRRVRFSKFFPLGAAVRRGLVELVSHEEVPLALSDFPKFRNHANPKAALTDDGWWIWDGKSEQRVGLLDDVQKRYPRLGVINDTALIEMIEGKSGPDDLL